LKNYRLRWAHHGRLPLILGTAIELLYHHLVGVMIMNTVEDGWNQFVKLCSSLHKPKNFSDLLDVFLTIEEKENIATRYLIVQALLRKEKPQREIAKDLNVSIAKITRGSNELKRVDKKVLHYLLEVMG